MNSAALLALLADLYAQLTALNEENLRLRELLSAEQGQRSGPGT